MLTRFETVRKAESRTRSELVREALRVYFEGRYPSVRPTDAELTAIRRGASATTGSFSMSITCSES